MRTLNKLDEFLSDSSARAVWAARARLEALVSGCPGSLDSVRSGVKCYLRFAARLLDKSEVQAIPPTADDLLAWSMLFRHPKTFSNYLGYLRLGCMLVKADTEVFDNPAVKRAKKGVARRMNFKSRPRMFLQFSIVESMFEKVYTGDRLDLECAAMLFLVTYTFLLRLPSEALPIARGCVGMAHNEQSWLYMDDGLLCLKLARRKNKPEGSLLKRACWCSACRLTCPVHVLWPYIESMPVGHKPFGKFSPAKALSVLRAFLKELGVAGAHKYRTHDWRRGHAKDMQLKGATLYQILMAGEWKSPAFLAYMDMVELELGATMEAHMAESSSEDESGVDE